MIQRPALACIRLQAHLYTSSFVRVDLIDAQDIGLWGRVSSERAIAAHVFAHVIVFVPVDVTVASRVARSPRLAMGSS